MNSTDIIRTIESLRKKYILQQRKCQFKDCKNISLKHSHILQKNGILNKIAYKNHILQFNIDSLYDLNNQNKFSLRKIGIQKVFSFPGFCSKHDDDIFKSIEKTEINFDEKITHILFAYRAICNEIYRKQVMLDIYKEITEKNIFKFPVSIFFESQLFNEKYGIKNLQYFKECLESDLVSQTNNFEFIYLKFNKIDLCISAPLNIYNPKDPKTFENKKEQSNYVTSIFNIFPYQQYSYLLIAQHKDFKCNWSENLISNFKKSDENQKLKIISDLITLRSEFWCISPELYKDIGNEKFEKLFRLWKENITNHNYDLKTDFNLFENYCG